MRNVTSRVSSVIMKFLIQVTKVFMVLKMKYLQLLFDLNKYKSSWGIQFVSCGTGAV